MSEMITVYNDGKREYMVMHEGKKHALKPRKSITVPEEYGVKLMKAYPRDLKNRDEMGGETAKDVEIARLRAENAKLKSGQTPSVEMFNESKERIKDIKGLGEKSALKMFEEAEAYTLEEQLEVLNEYAAEKAQ